MELSIKMRKFLGMVVKEQLPFLLLTVTCKGQDGTARQGKKTNPQDGRCGSFTSCHGGQNEKSIHPAVGNSQHLAGMSLLLALMGSQGQKT